MLQPSKILIVDDEPLNVDYLEQELEDLGYVTESARNGREALEKVAVGAPDLILLERPLHSRFNIYGDFAVFSSTKSAKSGFPTL